MIDILNLVRSSICLVLRTLEFSNDGTHSELTEFEVPLADEVSKLTRLRSLNLARTIYPYLLSLEVVSRMKSLSMLAIRNATLTDFQASRILSCAPCLTVLNLFRVEGLSGISWLRHQRLEQFSLTASRLDDAEIANENTPIVLTNEHLPNIMEMAVSFRHPNGLKYSPCVSLKGLQRLRTFSISPTQVVDLDDMPLLEVRFDYKSSFSLALGSD